MKPRLFAISCAALATIGLVGCGSDTKSSGEAPTKADYIATADKMCVASDKELDKLFEEAAADDDPRGLFDGMADVLTDLIKDLRELTPPKGDEREVEEVYNALQDGIDKIKNASDDEILTMDDPLAKASQLAQEYGFKECGNEDSETDSGGGEAPSKADYITEADSICAATEAQIQQAAQTMDTTTKEYFDGLADVLRSELKQLRALTPPPGDEVKVAAIYNEVEKAIEHIEQSSPEELFTTLPEQSVDNPFTEANKLAKDYGMAKCGS